MRFTARGRRSPSVKPGVECLDDRILLSAIDYVSDLAYVEVSNGWGPVEKDTSVGGTNSGDGQTLSIYGSTYAKGLGAHAASEVEVALDKNYATFRADIGFDDEIGFESGGNHTWAIPVHFQVLGDGVTLYDSGEFTSYMPKRSISVDVTGYSTMTLKVDPIPNVGNCFDHVDWADASLERLPAPIAGTDYHLVWNDEFSGTSVDTSKWNNEGPWGAPLSSTWDSTGNFSYSPSNVTVADGEATIAIQHDGDIWSGGVLSTDSDYMFEYGYVEARLKLPAGQGFYSAMWLYGGSTADELDMMEMQGGDTSTIYEGYFFPGQHRQYNATATDWSSDYHVFGMKWEPGRITYYIDGMQTATWTESVPARPMYLMINQDVMAPSDWGGGVDETTPDTGALKVDYVRIYQL